MSPLSARQGHKGSSTRLKLEPKHRTKLLLRPTKLCETQPGNTQDETNLWGLLPRWCSRKESRDASSIPGSRRFPGVGNASPLQYSCLENLMDRGAWQATVHEVARVGHNLATKPTPCTWNHIICGLFFPAFFT